MFLWEIAVLLLYGSLLAALGAITLALIPKWRITKGNILLFVFGSFWGIVALTSLSVWGTREAYAGWGFSIQTPWVSTLLGHVVTVVGAELGGLLLLYLTALIFKPRHRPR